MTPNPADIRQHYVGIESLPLSFNPTGWNSENFNFEEAIKQIRPSVIIEAGVYLGRSVSHMLTMAKKHGMSPILYAVDAWVGEAGHPIGHVPAWPTRPTWREPTQVQQFLFNIKHSGWESQVIPIQEFTSHGAAILRAWDVKADLIYLDGDHLEPGCYSDLAAYWPLLRVGGRMIGDDLNGYGGVWRAVGRFAQEHGQSVRAESGQFVIDKVSE